MRVVLSFAFLGLARSRGPPNIRPKSNKLLVRNVRDVEFCLKKLKFLSFLVGKTIDRTVHLVYSVYLVGFTVYETA